jgi:heat shock protein HtpX
MADKFPTTFVDEKTGQVKSMESMWDKLEADVLPKVGKWGVIGAKTAMIGAMTSALPIVLPITAAIYLYSKSKINGAIGRMQDEEDLRKKEGPFGLPGGMGGLPGRMGRRGGMVIMGGDEEAYDEFDMNKPADRANFVKLYGARHPSLPDDILAMAKAAQLKEIPVVRMTHGMFPGPDDYLCAATSRPDGTKPVVMIGRLAEQELTPGEMRAVIGHELTHVKLGHVKDKYNDISRSLLSKALNVGLIATGVITTLGAFTLATPFFAGIAAIGLMCAKVALVVGGASLVNTALTSIQSRRREDLCDQGAAILTGGTADLSNALKKIKGGMMKMHQRDADLSSMMSGRRPGAAKVKEVGGFMRFLIATHPTAEHREAKLKSFEEKHKTYCESKRAEFKAAFNAAAAKPEAKEAVAIEMRTKFDLGAGGGKGGLLDLLGRRAPAKDPQLTLPGMEGPADKEEDIEDLLGALFGGAAARRRASGIKPAGNDDMKDDPFGPQDMGGQGGRVIIMRGGMPRGMGRR